MVGGGAIFAGFQLGTAIRSPLVIWESEATTPPVTQQAKPSPTQQIIDRTGIAPFGQWLPDTVLDIPMVFLANRTKDDVEQIIGVRPHGVSSAVSAMYENTTVEPPEYFGVVIAEFENEDDAVQGLRSFAGPRTELIESEIVELEGGNTAYFEVHRDLRHTDTGPSATGSVVWAEGTHVIWISSPFDRLLAFKDELVARVERS